MFEPEKKDVSSTGSWSESESEEIESEKQNETRLQILTGVLLGIVKTKKGKLTAYVAKKSMLSVGFFTTNKLSVP